MIETNRLKQLHDEFEHELLDDILPYWNKHSPDTVNGGFVGRVTHDNMQVVDASKGAILNARLLWTFSACYRAFPSEDVEKLANRAYRYLLDYFWDKKHGGVYWMLDAKGKVEDDRKHIYAQSFAIYAFSEFYAAFGDDEALEWAKKLYRLVVEHSSDPENGGYFEAFSRDWTPLDDVRLSEKDINEPKSMNTHLHVLEAFTNLYRYWRSDELKKRLESLIDVFLEHIIASDGRSLVLFMDVDWTVRSDEVSFGHDIEASWLLMEAAEVLEDDMRLQQTQDAALMLTDTVMQNGMDIDGGLFNEADPNGLTDDNKDWWPQAEGVVGFLNAFEVTNNKVYLNAAEKNWSFIRQFVLDKEHGEWHEKVNRKGEPCREDKVRSWKGPYHNARACLEVLRRTDKLMSAEKDGSAKRSAEPQH